MYIKFSVFQKLFSIIVLQLFVFSCKNNNLNVDNQYFKYSKTVKIVNENNNNFVLEYPNLSKKITIDKNKLPIKYCITINTPTIGYLSELELIASIKGVCNPEYIYNVTIQKSILTGKVMNFGSDQNPNVEKILASKADFIFTSYNPNLQNVYAILEKSGKTIIYVEDYNEECPLAKAELLKLFGKLFNKENIAINKFNYIKNNYLELKNRAQKEQSKPTAFAKIMYGDVWFMPQANSASAIYYSDAGFNYYWKDINSNKSLELSFEQVFSKAEQADFWLDVSDVNRKEYLLNFNEFYKNFAAYKTNNMFAISERKNMNGANDFYETGVVRADLVLKDLVYIAHPKLLPTHKLMFYKQLN